MLQKLTTLHYALAFSLGVHALLLVVRFVDPEGFNRVFQDTPLEVVLVNSRSQEAPVKAQAIAQSNLAGGGEADKGRATSPLPPSPNAEVGDADETSERQIEQLQESQQQLLAQIRNEISALPPPDPRKQAESTADQNQEERRRQLVDQLAEIEKRISEENARPKKRYISPATREEVYAIYYDQLRRKVEERGTRNFPEFRGRKLYGELTMIITIDAAGEVLSTEVVSPSTEARLDRQAVTIVKASAPFGPFTEAMRRKADQLVITQRFKFSREEGLQTTLSAN